MSCAQNVTGVIRDWELMSRGFDNILHEQTLTERAGDGGKMRHYEPIIVINEAAIHHICVTARKSGPGGLGGGNWGPMVWASRGGFFGECPVVGEASTAR